MFVLGGCGESANGPDGNSLRRCDISPRDEPVLKLNTRPHIKKPVITAAEFLCISCPSKNKELLFSYIAFTRWFLLTQTGCVYWTVRNDSLNIILVKMSLR